MLRKYCVWGLLCFCFYFSFNLYMYCGNGVFDPYALFKIEYCKFSQALRLPKGTHPTPIFHV